MTSSRARRLPLRMWRPLVERVRTRDTLLVIAAALVSAGVIFGLLYDVFDGALRRWNDRDVRRQAHLVALAVDAHADNASSAALQKILESLARSGNEMGLVVCAGDGTRIGAAGVGSDLGCRSGLALAAMNPREHLVRGTIGSRPVVVNAESIGAGTLLVAQDRSAGDARRRHVLQMMFIGAEGALAALLLIARTGARIGSRRTEEAARSVVLQMRTGDGNGQPVPTDLRLLVRDVRDTVEQLRRQKPPQIAGVERLRAAAAGESARGGLVVLANREPYAHERLEDGRVVVQQPASGLVTGIEPMLRACGGTWIGFGGGSADRDHADARGRVAVPPDSPEYVLRRLWIEEQEYEHYYSGFANEAIWPLCHTAHTRPSFRPADWTAYQSVNEAFARAAVEEAGAGSLILIQDYHFALVPRMIRNDAAHAVTSLFWHIPWPNSEVFGICPWKEALLEGMLGADIVGFHTRQYCLNFLDAAQRYLECRADMEEMSISFHGHKTLVRPYPISVEWPYPAASRAEGNGLRMSLGIGADVHVSLGVDRADYTKGLLERVDAVEFLLDQNPSLAGRYIYIQLASPTRTHIRKYRQLAEDLREKIAQVNERFGNAGWQPIMLHMKTFSPTEVRAYYAMADSALVTPLHDGMNLVAKEYVASCEDGEGILVLSRFAGAAKELDGALLVNPYDTQQTAQAILRALRMPSAEKRARMNGMRAQISENSIYLWSEKLLEDMKSVRKQGARFWPQRLASPEAIEQAVV